MALLEDIIPNLPPPGKEYEPLEKAEAVGPLGTPEDLAVLKQVTQDLAKAEAWVAQKGLLSDWDKCERLFLFRVPIQYWEDTLVPRAHLGMPVVLEHIESLMPQLMIGLFGEDPPFMSRPRPGTKMDTAQANDALLSWELTQSGFREQFRLLTKSSLEYGTGIGKWGWKSYTETTTKLRRKQPEKFEPLAVGGVTVPQEGSDETEEVPEEIAVNEPTFEWVDNRHILVDPSLRTPDIRDAKFVIHRIYPTLTTLNQWRDQEGFNIPPKAILLKLFFPPAEPPKSSPMEGSSIDVNQDFAATPRAQAVTIDPYMQPLEVVEYTTKTRVYTILQRRLVIRKADNKYGVINFVSSQYIDVLGAFYGLGIAHLIGGEQRVQQGVINAFLDDLSLALNGMFIRQRGANVPTTQIRMRPGGVIDTDTEKGIQPMARQPVPIESLSVIANSDARAARRTSANEMIVQGAAPSEKSSITRTATGVNSLAGGVGARLQYFVENLARQVYIPTLEAFQLMNGKHLKPSQVSRILSQELNLSYDGDAIDLLNVRCKFEILAGARMQSKRAMTQALPLLFQFILTDPVMTGLKEQGRKVNIGEMVKMIFQVSGWPNIQDVIQKFTAEDEQRAAATNPAMQAMAAQQAKQQQGQQDNLATIEEETVARTGRDVIKSLLKQAEMKVLAGEKKGTQQ